MQSINSDWVGKTVILWWAQPNPAHAWSWLRLIVRIGPYTKVLP